MSLKDDVAALDRAEKALERACRRAERAAPRSPARIRALDVMDTLAVKADEVRERVKHERRRELCQGGGLSLWNVGTIAPSTTTCRFCGRVVGVTEGRLGNKTVEHPKNVDVHAATSAGNLLCGSDPTGARAEYTDDPHGLRKVTCSECRSRLP